MRKVTHKKRLIDRDVFQGLDFFTLLNLQHAVYQQKRVTVGQLLKNLVDVHHDYLLLARRNGRSSWHFVMQRTAPKVSNI